jgi:hypothetical protein
MALFLSSNQPLYATRLPSPNPTPLHEAAPNVSRARSRWVQPAKHALDMRTWPLIYPEALTCPCIASSLPERTPPWAYLSAFVFSKKLVLATINSPVHSRQNAEKREQKQPHRPSHPRSSHTAIAPRSATAARPALQRMAARSSIVCSELHHDQHPGALTRQKGACILAVVPHVLQALFLHFHHSTGRMHPADSLSPARDMLPAGMPI